jgi:hypothetical protein
LKNAIDSSRRQLHQALVTGADTTDLRAELGRFEAEAAGIAAAKARSARHVADVFDEESRAEAVRLVFEGNERLQALLSKFAIEEAP